MALLNRGEFHHGNLLSGWGDGKRDLIPLRMRRLTGGSAGKATSDVLKGSPFGLRHFEVGEYDEEDEEDDKDDEHIGPEQCLKEQRRMGANEKR